MHDNYTYNSISKDVNVDINTGKTFFLSGYEITLQQILTCNNFQILSKCTMTF